MHVLQLHPKHTQAGAGPYVAFRWATQRCVPAIPCHRVHKPCALLQVDVLKGEKEVLEESAAAANAKMQETREAMAAQTKQLGQLQYLPPRLQDMQEQASRKLFSAVLTTGCAATLSKAVDANAY